MSQSTKSEVTVASSWTYAKKLSTISFSALASISGISLSSLCAKSFFTASL